MRIRNLCFIIALIISFIGNYVTAQTASASWPLTASSAGTSSGQVTVTAETLNILSINQYTGIGGAQRLRVYTTYTGMSAVGWPSGVTGEMSDVWVQFAVSPKTGNRLTVSSISMELSSHSSSDFKANAYYSTDATFATRTSIYLNGSSYLPVYSTTATAVTASITGQSIIVNDGQTLYVRVYPWRENSSVNATKYFCIRAVTVTGTTESLTQATSAIWPYDGTESVSITGPALNPSVSSVGMSLNNASTTVATASNALAGSYKNSSDWTAESAINTSRYLQYEVGPKYGGTLAVSSISFALGATGTTNMKATVSYSTDGFATSSVLISDVSLSQDAVTAYTIAATPSVTKISDTDQRLQIRIYPYNTAAETSTNALLVDNVTVTGGTSGTVSDPPTVTTNSPTYISDTYATSGGNVTSDGGISVTAAGVCWNTSGSPTISDTYTVSASGTVSFSSIATSLAPSTTYYLRAFATNPAGTTYGAQYSFTTLASQSVPTVTTNAISKIMVTTALGGGSVTQWGGNTVTAKGICWSTSASPTIADNHTTNGSDIGSYTSSMVELTAGTTYYVRAYATNGIGTGYGPEYVFATQIPAADAYKVVAQDGSGDYTTIQSAFNAVPDYYTGRWIIRVKPGTYYEKVSLASTKTNVVLIGDNPDNTILTYDAYADQSNGAGGTWGTSNSQSVAIDPDDFTAINITFQNTIKNNGKTATNEQAVALRSNGDRQSFWGCKVTGFQDTYYALGNVTLGRTYFNHSYLAGSVDFIFGPETVILDSCEIHMNRNGGAIAAPNTNINSLYGIVFLDCKLTNDAIDFNGTTISSYYLGRPWQNKPRCAYLRCNEPSTVAATGWTSMTAALSPYFAEYACTGAGYLPASRATNTDYKGNILTDAQAASYTITTVFAKATNPVFGWDWKPSCPDLVYTPFYKATNISSVPQATTAVLNWTNGSSVNHAVFISTGSSSLSLTNGQKYAVGATVGDWTCIYNGATNTTTISNLATTTTYHVIVADYNMGEGTGSEKYLLSDMGTFTTKKAQTISNFDNLSAKMVDGTVALTGYASSGLALSYTSSNTSIATISENSVNLVAAGTVSITATQAGNSEYGLVTKTITLVVSKSDQSIIGLSNIDAKVGDGTITLAGIATSGNTVTYTSSSTTIASVSGTVVTINKAGTVTITATQTGNTSWNACSTTITLAISKKAQTITLGDQVVLLSAGTLILSPTTNSGLTDFTYSTTATSDVATLASNVLTLVATGTFTVSVSQAGDASWAAVTQTINVTIAASSLTTQLISGLSDINKYVGDPDLILTGLASSGLPLVYSSSDETIVGVTGSTLTIKKAGTAIITAKQDGDATHAPAPAVQVQVTISKLAQAITGLSNLTVSYGVADLTPTGAVSSSLVISYSSNNTSVAQIVDGKIKVVGAGSAIITATQTGNDSYLAATPVNFTLTVEKAETNISWSTPDPIVYGTALSSTQLNATSNSTATALYSPSAGLVNVGNQTLTVTFPANANYKAASKTVQLVVSQKPVTITVTGGTYVYDGSAKPANISLSESVSYEVTYNSSTSAPVNVNTYNVTASITNGNYSGSATGVIVITKATPSITWSTPASITYGASINETQLNANSTSDATAIYSVASGTILDAGTYTLHVSYASTTNFIEASKSVNITVNKAPASRVSSFDALATMKTISADQSPVITKASDASVTYTSASTAIATIVSGKVHPISAGTTNILATVSGSLNYKDTIMTQSILIIDRDFNPITISAIADKTYGTDASFTITASGLSSGAYKYSIESGPGTIAVATSPTVNITGAGTINIKVEQDGDANYVNGIAYINVVVNKANSNITWNNPSNIVYGTKLNATQLNATSNNPSTAVYSPASGTILDAGTQALLVTYAETSNYLAASKSVSIVIDQASQSITGLSSISKTYGDPVFGLTGSVSTGLSIVYTSSNTSVATIIGASVTITGAGNAVITATQAGNNNYSATSTTLSLTVARKSQSISGLTTAVSKTYGDANIDLSGVTASSALPLSFTSSNSSIISVSGTTCVITGTGTATVVIEQAGNSNYLAVSSTMTVSVAEKVPSITWNAPTAISYGTALSATQLNATSNSPSSAVYSPALGTILAAGTQTLKVEYAATLGYTAASQTISLTVNKIDPVISWSPATSFVYNTVTNLNATASGLNNVSLSGTFKYTEGTLEFAGSTAKIGAGQRTVVVTFTPDDKNYNLVSSSVIFNVTQAPQSINGLASELSKTYGDANFSLSLSSSSGLVPVTIVSTNSSVVSVSGTVCTVVSAGYAEIVASQAGNTNYAAVSATMKITVAKASQSISGLPATKIKTYGDAAFKITGILASTRLPLIYSSSDASVATLSDSTVTIVGAGSAVISVVQNGTNNYNPATVTMILNVSKKAQTITGTPSTISKTYGDTAFSISNVTVSTGSELKFYSSSPTVISTSSNTLTITGAGQTIISIVQAGNSNYAAVTTTFTVNVAKKTLTVTALNDSMMRGTTIPTDFNYSITGFIGADSLLVANYYPAFSVESKDSMLAVGKTMSIVPSAGTLPLLDNYSYKYVSGKLKIITNTATRSMAQIEISVYPNPIMSGSLKVVVPSVKAASISISSLSGATLISKKLTDETSEIDMEALPAGNYIIRVITSEGIAIKQVVKL